MNDKTPTDGTSDGSIDRDGLDPDFTPTSDLDGPGGDTGDDVDEVD
jgi:hypothetical protein